MGRIDHQLFGLAPFAESDAKILLNIKPALADGLLIDRLGSTVLGKRIAPPQAVPDQEQETAENPSIIEPAAARATAGNKAQFGVFAPPITDRATFIRACPERH